MYSDDPLPKGLIEAAAAIGRGETPEELNEAKMNQEAVLNALIKDFRFFFGKGIKEFDSDFLLQVLKRKGGLIITSKDGEGAGFVELKGGKLELFPAKGSKAGDTLEKLKKKM